MRPRCAYILFLGALSAGAANAQTPVGETFCKLYEQVTKQGRQAFVDLQGAQIADGRWEIKDLSVPDGKCFIRTDVEEADLLTCTVGRPSADDARKWTADIAGASRECLKALSDFKEQSKTVEEDGVAVDRISWSRKTDDGPLNISVATVVRGDKAQGRVSIRLSKKD